MTKSVRALRKIKAQHKQVIAALAVTKRAATAADRQAQKLSTMIDRFPNKDRDLYAEDLGRIIEFLELKFVFIGNRVAKR